MQRFTVISMNKPQPSMSTEASDTRKSSRKQVRQTTALNLCDLTTLAVTIYTPFLEMNIQRTPDLVGPVIFFWVWKEFSN
jgi:hypothetical protein